MTRMILRIEERDKSWLERRAHATGATQGVWKDGDALSYQRRLRREWS